MSTYDLIAALVGDAAAAATLTAIAVVLYRTYRQEHPRST